MKFPRKLVTREKGAQHVSGGVVYPYPSDARDYPFHLTPIYQPDKWQHKARYGNAPMFLSSGEWTVHGRMTLSKESLKMTGEGYHTVFKASSSNSEGIFHITANAVGIKNVQFNMNGRPGKAIEIADSVASVSIQNCVFVGLTNAYGIFGDNADRVTIENCYFAGGANDVIYVLDSNEVAIRNNRIIPGSGVEINLASTTAGTVSQQSNFGIVSGNHVGVGSIRYNTTATSGNHQISGNNANATLVTY